MVERVQRFGPLCGRPSRVMSLRDDETLALPMRIAHHEAELRGRERIQDGMLRPHDAHRADIETALAVWVPLWWVRGRFESVHPAASPLPPTGLGRFANARSTAPALGETREVSVVLPARYGVDFDPSPRVKIAVDALVAWASLPSVEGELLAPDVTEIEARRDGTERLLRDDRLRRLVGKASELRVTAVSMVLQPLWLRRYHYAGEVSGGAVEECHVALCAATGTVLSEKHPTAWKSLAGRVRGVFRRGG